MKAVSQQGHQSFIPQVAESRPNPNDVAILYIWPKLMERNLMDLKKIPTTPEEWHDRNMIEFWFFKSNSDDPGSLIWICENFGLNIGSVRREARKIMSPRVSLDDIMARSAYTQKKYNDKSNNKLKQTYKPHPQEKHKCAFPSCENMTTGKHCRACGRMVRSRAYQWKKYHQERNGGIEAPEDYLYRDQRLSGLRKTKYTIKD
jgi:hypothetical protein